MLLGAGPVTAPPPPPIDDLGRRVELGKPPRRIVALAPSVTETLFAIGVGDRVVGVSEQSDFPPEAAKLPAVGALAGDLERIVALRPDLVVVTTDGNDPEIARRLAKFGIPVWACSASTYEGVARSIERLGDALGRPEGRKLAATMRARAMAVEKRVANLPRPRAVWMVWPEPPVVAGPGSFLDDLIRRAGGTNAFGDSGKAWPSVGREQLAAAKVEVVLHPDSKDSAGAFAEAKRGELPKLLAGARWEGIDGSIAERPGPRLADALERIARALHPR